MGEPRDTRACHFTWDPRGFVHATMRPGLEMDLNDAQEALAATTQVADGARCPVLVDTRGIRSQSKEAREFFVGPEAARVTSAVALIVGSPVSRMIGNFFLRKNVHRNPTRLFSDESEAIAWLQTNPS